MIAYKRLPKWRPFLMERMRMNFLLVACIPKLEGCLMPAKNYDEKQYAAAHYSDFKCKSASQDLKLGGVNLSAVVGHSLVRLLFGERLPMVV